MRRPDRVLFPESGFTKNDAVDYYRRAAKWMLPHLKDVPVSFKRFPDTVRGESFWEKDAPSFTPEWVRTVKVPRRSDESEIHYVVVNDVKTLAWIADVGGVASRHASRVKRLRRPALAALVVNGIAAGPRVRRVADGAERFLRPEGALAVIAGDSESGRVHVVLATHLAAKRAAPTNCHRFRTQ